VKRSLLTEAAGVPVGLAVAGANCVDFKLARQAIDSVPVARPTPTKARPQGMCLDKGYDYLEVWELLEEFGFTAHLSVRGQDAQPVKRKAGQKARRWVVERTHSWMNRFRGVLIRWSKKPENYLALLHLVCAAITYRCAGLFG
jgi:transposase